MEQARAWLQRNQIDPASMPEAPEVPTMATAEMSEHDEAAIEAAVARTLEAEMASRPSRRPARYRAEEPVPDVAPDPFSTRVPDPDRPARQRNRIAGLALGIGVAVLLANLAGVLFNEVAEDDTPRPTLTTPTTSPIIAPVVEFSEGSISSAEDPCTGVGVSGDLEAIVTYLPDPEAPEVSIEIMGPALRGTDGTDYFLEVSGSTTGSPGQETFVFETTRMVLVREDGVEFFDRATVTVEIVDGRPGSWSYSSEGADCPG